MKNLYDLELLLHIHPPPETVLYDDFKIDHCLLWDKERKAGECPERFESLSSLLFYAKKNDLHYKHVEFFWEPILHVEMTERAKIIADGMKQRTTEEWAEAIHRGAKIFKAAGINI